MSMVSILHLHDAYLSRPLVIISFIFIILDFLSLFWRNFMLDWQLLPGFHIQSKVRKVVEVHGSVYCRSFPLKISSEKT